jgi:hypothetical protein
MARQAEGHHAAANRRRRLQSLFSAFSYSQGCVGLSDAIQGLTYVGRRRCHGVLSGWHEQMRVVGRLKGDKQIAHDQPARREINYAAVDEGCKAIAIDRGYENLVLLGRPGFVVRPSHGRESIGRDVRP